VKERINEYASSAKEQVIKFIDYLINDLLEQKYTKGKIEETFLKVLNINPETLQVIKDIRAKNDDIINSTKNRFEDKIKSISETEEINETFFFYPVAGLLNIISREIKKKD